MTFQASGDEPMPSGGTPESQAAPQSMPQSAPQSQPSPQMSSQPEPQFGGQPQEQFQPQGNVYDLFKQHPDFQGADDQTIAGRLYQGYSGYQQAQEQLRQYQEALSSPAIQDFYRNRESYNQWLAQRNQAAQAQPQAEQAKKWWDPPQIKDSWRSFIVRDPQTGEVVIDPKAPYEAKAAIQEWQNYTSDFASRFVSDPESTLKPFVETEAKRIAQELVQEHLSQFQNQQRIKELDAQHASWLYDQDGQITPRGQAAMHYIAEAESLGINGVEPRWQYVQSMMQRDALYADYAQRQQMAQRPPQGQPQGQPQMQPQMQQQLPPQVRVQQEPAPRVPTARQRAARMPSRSGVEAPGVPQQRMTPEERTRLQFAKDGLI